MIDHAAVNGSDRAVKAVGGAHVAFKSPDHTTVDAFYEAALAAGAKDNGAPGLRTHYHEKAPQ